MSRKQKTKTNPKVRLLSETREGKSLNRRSSNGGLCCDDGTGTARWADAQYPRLPTLVQSHK